VGAAASGKTTALQAVQKRTGTPLINVNLELSRQLLDLTERQRALQVPRLLADLTATAPDSLILLDNIEVLFDKALQQDPLRLLQGLSRNCTVVASWSGALVDGQLTYATADHPEYRRYPVKDFLAVAAAPLP